MNIVELPVRNLPPDLIARFAAIVGDRYAVTAPSEIAPYLTEERGLYHGRSPLVLRPGSVAEVAAILKLANETKTPIVPQGGNTGLVGGQTPHQGEVLMSLRRLDRVREVDPTSNTMTCEAASSSSRPRRPQLQRGVCFLSPLEPKEAAQSAATSPPMPAARARSPMGSHASSCSGSRWCSPTAASSTICAS